MRKKKKIAPRKKKIAPRDFDRQFVEIGKKYLRTLQEEEREKRLAAFERAVISRSDAGTHAKFSGTSETPGDAVSGTNWLGSLINSSSV